MNLDKPLVHCFGAGRAARTLLRLLHEAGQIRIGVIVNRSLASAQAAVRFIGAGHAAESLPEVTPGAGLLLGCPESCLLASTQQILEQQLCQGLAFAFHLSASVDGAALTGLAPLLASCHPALAFADPDQALSQFAGSWCVLEGSASLLPTLHIWLETIGARVLPVPSLDKRQYHAAAMAASNFMLACLGLAERLAERAGLPAQQAHELLTALALRNVQAAKETSASAAFTGPLERGDSQALESLLAHLNTYAATIQAGAESAETKQQLALRRDNRAWASLLALGLPLVEAKASLDPDTLSRLHQLCDPLVSDALG